MSIEEKAKAYDEALAIAKQVINNNCSEVEKLCLECVLPELKESDDERIRKGLIQHLKELRNWKAGTMSPIKVPAHYDAWITYLEKQNDANKEYWRGYREGKQEILDKYAEIEKQKECLVDDSKTSASEDEKIRKSIIRLLQVGGYMSPEEKNNAFAYLEKQKDLFKDGVGHYFYDGNTTYFIDAPAMLKSLHPKKNISYGELPLVSIDHMEGLDTDFEKQVGAVIASAMNREHQFTSEYVKWTAQQLMESAKDKLCIKPRWKPSKEHFQGLRRAITKAEKGSYAWNSLTDLYEQLKKL